MNKSLEVAAFIVALAGAAPGARAINETEACEINFNEDSGVTTETLTPSEVDEETCQLRDEFELFFKTVNGPTPEESSDFSIGGYTNEI